MTVTGGVATVDVGMANAPLLGFANAINAAAVNAGADTLVVNGTIIDENLAINFGLRAQAGETFLGGTIEMGQGAIEGETYPTVTITGPVW